MRRRLSRSLSYGGPPAGRRRATGWTDPDRRLSGAALSDGPARPGGSVRMEQQGMTRKDLEGVIGPDRRGAEPPEQPVHWHDPPSA